MKNGDRVTFVDAKGKRQRAHVEQVVGTGISYFKVLNLRVGKDQLYENVPNVRDAQEGEAHWSIADEAEPVIAEAPPEARTE